MAIDPNIALGVRPVAPIDPVESYGKVLQLRNMMQQGQLHNEQLKAATLENQTRERDINAQQTLSKLLTDHTSLDDQGQLKTDHASIVQGLAKAGFGGEALKYDAQRRADLKNAIDLQKTQAEVGAKKADRLASLAGSVPKVDWSQPPEIVQQQVQRSQQALKGAMDAAVKEGLLDPQHAQAIEQQPYSQDLEAQVGQFAQQAMSAKDQHDTHLADLEEVRKQTLFPAQQQEGQSKAATAAMELAGRTVDGVKDQGSWTAWRAKQPPTIQAQIPEQFSDDAKGQVQHMAVGVKDQPGYDVDKLMAQFGLKGNTEFDQFALAKAQKAGRPLTPDEKLSTVTEFAEAKKDPVMRGLAIAQANLSEALKRIQLEGQPTKEDAAMLADDIVNHRLAPDQISQIRGRGNGGLGIMIEREIKKVDPKFSWEQASAEYGLAKSPAFQNTVRYMDSVSESIPLVIDRANKLANGDVRGINALLNAGKNQVNDIDLKKFKTDSTLVADEIAKILQGGGTGNGTSDAKLKQASEILNASDSPRAIAAALGDVKELIGFRRKALTRGTYMENAAPEMTPAAAGGKKPLSEIFK